jgi:hypothetical protein
MRTPNALAKIEFETQKSGSPFSRLDLTLTMFSKKMQIAADMPARAM